MKTYNHKKIEKYWQTEWERQGLYTPDIKNSKDLFYNLWMFIYPSAEGLHAGHVFASTGSDIYGRFQRMNGKDVFQPFGYDSFGIHAENYAIKIDEQPQKVVARITKTYEKQMKSIGHGYDWTRTVTTSDVDYYRWTQWLFLKMWEKGLAYKKNAEVNFCPSCKTVLADEQVMTPKQAGKDPKDAKGVTISSSDDVKVCERCGTVVEKKNLNQWFFKITDYADRLLEGLEKIDWSKRVSIAQKQWIGKKEGVVLHHEVKDMDVTLTAFSAYPAWLFADTFLVIAPEHPVVSDLVRDTKYQKDVEEFVDKFKKSKTGKNRKLNEKDGIFTGRYVKDPFNGVDMPVWLANFALMDFGTGIIRCSAHDPRDYEFAQKYKIELKEVVKRTDPELPVNAHTNEGILKNSGVFTGEKISQKLIVDILGWIEKEGIGERNTNYHLRDWLVSRQRYWGAPIPMINCKKCDWQPVPEENLPVKLPEIEDYKPEGTGKGPLANHKDFYEVKCPKCEGVATRETDVMDTFVDSSWYFLRYPSVDAKSSAKLAFDPDISKKILPVDLYFGGAEHSVLHLMYARFVNMVMYDLKLVDHEEPFPKFYAHGLMIKDGAKMSKSRGNVVNPDKYVEKYSADTLRLYLMFMGPMDGYPDFRDSGIEGMDRFLRRIWRLFVNPRHGSALSTAFAGSSDEPITKDASSASSDSLMISKLHQTIKKVTKDIQEFKYNTAIASLMELVNVISNANDGSSLLRVSTKSKTSRSASADWLEIKKVFCKLLAPFAPHMAEELWQTVLGNKTSIHISSWPKWNEKYLKEKKTTIIIQVNGKLRSQFTVDAKISENEKKIVSLAKRDIKVAKWLKGAKPRKEIFIAGKLVNFVV